MKHKSKRTSLSAERSYWVELDCRSRIDPDNWVCASGYETEAEAVEAAKQAFLPSRIVHAGRIIRFVESER
jgi:hypothetical protein